jgi:hypothetical protein
MSAPVIGVASPVQTVVRTADRDGEPILRQPQEVYAPRAWSLSVPHQQLREQFGTLHEQFVVDAASVPSPLVVGVHGELAKR